MKRTDIINREIELNGYKTYLEIGVSAGTNLRGVKCDYKVGVDPDPKSKGTTHCMTSDEFFKQNEETFDIVFIDGLHEAEQVTKDIINSLRFLNKGGTIVLHDMNPKTKAMQEVPRISREWTGDCWKAMYQYRLESVSLAYTVDTDYGVGVIKPQEDAIICNMPIEFSDYENLCEYRKEWLGLISVKEYLSLNK